ncbi:MAG: segregation and condensation protein A, partial [Leifsonia sp.]
MAPSPDLTEPERSTESAEAVEAVESEQAPGFRVSLGDFEGPFDLLLSLIAKHELDITEISLSRVTDEFIAYLRRLDTDESLDEASEFLLVAATLLDLKVAGLLPQGELVDAEDVALLEARDLLFARLLQYRAFKEASGWFADRLEAEGRRHARLVRLEDKFRQRTPELVWTLSLDDFA